MLDVLNDKQKEAVRITDGPLLVLAGAGSGKTKVLTTKIAYLIKEKNVAPENILAITFTNKAAREMKDRVINMLGPIGYRIQISTFHSFGLYILKQHYEKVGLKHNFTILDSDDSLTIIKKIIKELGYDVKTYNPKAIRSKISSAKNELIDDKEYEKYVYSDFEEIVLKVYKKYTSRLLTNNSLDFDDLLMLPIFLLKSNPDILKRYQEQYHYVLIDEYQDTNEAQYMLSKMMSAKYKNICVVGDESQAIYSWRGANYKNILNFEKDYQNPKVVLLEENYRSTKNILNAANDVIKNNKARKDKNLWTENSEGVKIKYHKAESEMDEAFYVYSEIQKLLDNGVDPRDIAVLYRTNAQSRAIEEMLLKENIPYKVVGSFYFYNRKEIKDLISYLKLINNSYDDTSLLRVINVPKRGIGLRTIENISIKALEQGISIYEAIDSGKELQFKNMIEDFKKQSETMSITELVEYILVTTGIRNELETENTMEAEIRIENLEEFKTITRNFEDKNGFISLQEFLEEISLVSDIEEYKNNDNVITLMTVHSAKGLEFDNVFIIGLEEGIFPHANSLIDNEQIEEERRLCYVAITRAKSRLWLVNARRRAIFGDINYNLPSRFIGEISDDFLEIDGIIDSEKEITIPIDNENSDISYNVGEKIIHDTFGQGVIVRVDKSILTVAFPHPYGIKKILKGHRSIRKV